MSEEDEPIAAHRYAPASVNSYSRAWGSSRQPNPSPTRSHISCKAAANAAASARLSNSSSTAATIDSPPSKRSYTSPRREAQAQETKHDILAAAQRLFEQQGYPATTMVQVAKDAGVALKTVYLAFETKSGLLRALWNLLLRGDDESRPVAQQDWYRQVLEEPDPERRLRLNASNSTAGKQRISGVLEAIRSAAPSDPPNTKSISAGLR